MPEASHRRHRPLPDRSRLQGFPEGSAVGRPDRAHGPRRPGQGPGAGPQDIDDLMLGCGLPGGEQGFNMGRNVAVMLGYDHLPGTTITRYCSSSAADHPDGDARDRAARATRTSRPAVEMVTSTRGKGSSDSIPDTKNPLFAEAATPPPRPSRRARPGRPARAGPAPGRLHRDGLHRREPGPAQGHSRPSRTSSRSARRTAPNRRSRTASGARTSRGHARRRHRGEQGRRSACGHHAGGHLRAQSGLPPGRHGGRRQRVPAQRRRRGGHRDVGTPRHANWA